VAGNATLFEGTTVETHQSGSALDQTTLDLTSGPRVWLAAGSRGRIFSDRLVLEKGSGQMEKARRFRVEARGLAVRMEAGEGSARVFLAGGARVQVAALAGSASVLNSQGLLVASIRSGSTLEFAFQRSSGELWKLTGCLLSSAGHYTVTDEVTNVTVEVGGAGVDREAGSRVEISGAVDPTVLPISEATQFIRVSGIKRLSKNCAATDRTAAASASGNAGGAGRAGKSGGSMSLPVGVIAVIAGVAVAVVIGGLAATGNLTGGSAAAPVSR